MGGELAQTQEGIAHVRHLPAMPGRARQTSGGEKGAAMNDPSVAFLVGLVVGGAIVLGTLIAANWGK